MSSLPILFTFRPPGASKGLFRCQTGAKTVYSYQSQGNQSISIVILAGGNNEGGIPNSKERNRNSRHAITSWWTGWPIRVMLPPYLLPMFFLNEKCERTSTFSHFSRLRNRNERAWVAFTQAFRFWNLKHYVTPRLFVPLLMVIFILNPLQLVLDWCHGLQNRCFPSTQHRNPWSECSPYLCLLWKPQKLLLRCLFPV